MPLSYRDYWQQRKAKIVAALQLRPMTLRELGYETRLTPAELAAALKYGEEHGIISVESHWKSGVKTRGVYSLRLGS